MSLGGALRKKRIQSTGVPCVRAPSQCIATLATVRRETNSWRMALLMAGYMFALAYAASAATYHLTVALGGG